MATHAYPTTRANPAQVPTHLVLSIGGDEHVTHFDYLDGSLLVTLTIAQAEALYRRLGEQLS